MPIVLTISSPTSGDATAVFPEVINLKQGVEYELALIDAYVWYSFPNVKDTYNNNSISYNNGITNKPIVLSTGTYGVTELIAGIHAIMKENGDYTVVDGTDTFDINFIVNYSTLAVQIVVSNGYSLDLSGSEFGLLIGFTAVNVTVTQYGTLTPDITRSVDSLFIKCDIIQGSYSNGIADQVIHSFSPNGAPGTLLHINPRNLTWLKVNREQIREIRITLTDQLNRAIDTRGEGCSYFLQIRESKNSTQTPSGRGGI